MAWWLVAVLGLTAAAVPGCADARTGPGLEAGLTNSPAPGFDFDGSDEQAIRIADSTISRMGRRGAWDRTRFVTWNFFGTRRHIWDKHGGDVRIEGSIPRSGEEFVVLMNLYTKKGRAFKDGQPVTEADELRRMLDLGYNAWINDSYWLVMPYKLMDTGVTLKHLGEAPMEDGRAADVLELTFRHIGRTPRNKYHVYVSHGRGLVEQWAFFTDRNDEEPRFVCPWANWQRHGRIMLSDDRGPIGRLTDVAVFDELPPSVFRSPEPVDWSNLQDAQRSGAE